LIDANGILSVSARDVRTGKEHSIEVKPSYGLTDEQVENMLLDSFENAEEDFKQRQLIEARTEAESVIASAEKAYSSDAFNNLTEEEQMRDRAALEVLKASLSAGDHHVIRTELQKFNDATMHLAESMMDSAVQIALKGKKASEV
jgi:molecular chaperone DnaK (HSP70)